MSLTKLYVRSKIFYLQVQIVRFCLAGKYSWKSRINDASPRCFLSLRTCERGLIIFWYSPHFQLPPPIFLYELAMANRKIPALKFLPIFLCHKMGDQLLEPNLKFRQNNARLHSPQRCLVWSLRWDLCLEPGKKWGKISWFCKKTTWICIILQKALIFWLFLALNDVSRLKYFYVLQMVTMAFWMKLNKKSSEKFREFNLSSKTD